MTENVESQRFFHVTRHLSYNSNAPLVTGLKIEAGIVHNPFFRFYEGEINYPVTTPEGIVHCKAIRFLSAVKNGEIESRNLAHIAHGVAQHYLMLARELIMEEVRKDVDSNLPSRQSCLWMVETESDAKYWQKRLNGVSCIVVLKVHGVIHRTDASLLLGDSEPLSETYNRARRYWCGETSEHAEREVLFKGTAEVVDLISS